MKSLRLPVVLAALACWAFVGPFVGLLGAGLAAVPAAASDPFLRNTAPVRVVKAAGPAVVNITTEQIVQRHSSFGTFGRDPYFDRFFRDFFEPRGAQKVQSLGSGVVIDERGHILTNEHVIARADRIRVTMADGREFDATVLGADPNNDIAVLRAETDKKLPWVAPASSRDLMVGEPVIAIGNPFGLSNSVTTGVISAVNRSIRTEHRTFHGFLQTDASINPGTSGGPLLNAAGELIGINTAVYGGGQGIGFAIPIDVANRVVAELIAHGEVSPVWLGLEFQDLTPTLREALDLDSDGNGALVNRVRRKSPAEKAGIERGDVVTHVEKRPVHSAHEFFEMLESVTMNQELQFDLLREGSPLQLSLRAEEIPSDLVAQLADELLGLKLELDRGVFVVTAVRTNSGAARTGILAGDLVLGINGQRLADGESFRRSVLDLRGRSRALLVVQRGTGRYNVTVPLV